MQEQTRRMSFYLPESLIREIKKTALDRSQTASALALLAFKQYLENKQEEVTTNANG